MFKGFWRTHKATGKGANSSAEAGDERDKAATNQEKFGHQGINFLMWVGLAGLIALLVYAFHCGKWQEGLSVTGVGIVLAGAALLMGGVLGFLFGMPHTLPPAGHSEPNGNGKQGTAKPESPGTGEPSYLPNTNLEQISDWLTKILVGVGLTELTSIPLKMKQLAAFLALGLGGSETLALGLSVYFVLCGFLIGFLWTRLYLQRALRWSDVSAETLTAAREAKQDSSQALAAVRGLSTQALAEAQDTKDKQKADDEAWNLVIRQLNPRSGLLDASEEDLSEKIKNATVSTQEKIFHEAVMVRSSNWRANKDLMERTIPIFKALVAIDSENPEYHGELGFALKDKGDFKGALEQLEIAISKRPKLQISGGAAWYEFLRAVCRISLDKKFIETQPSADDTRQLILKDLKAARDSGLSKAIEDEVPACKWIGLNGLKEEFGLSNSAASHG